MEIRVLRYFLAVAREGNITRAAESLHIAQPSLSKQLMELERELGKQLLYRGKRKITLTEEGILLKQRAEEIVSLVEKTEHEIAYDFGEIVGEIFIGGNATPAILQTAVSLKKENRNIQFHFYSGDATEVMERLEHGNLDFAVVLEPVDTVKYDFISLPDRSEWGILMKAEDRLAEKESITREVLCRLPLILHQRIGLQQEIAHWAQVDLERLQIAATYNVVHGSPIPFVQQGLGYFLTTRDLLAPELPETVCFKPLHPKLPVNYALAWKKHTTFSKAAGMFLKQLKERMKNFS